MGYDPGLPGNSPHRWPLIILLFSGMVVCYAHRGALSIAAPVMIKEMGLSPGVMGVLLSAFFWSYSLLQVPSGWLVDRLGVKRSYAVGYTLWSAASAATGFATAQLVLIAVRMGVGIGQAVAFPASSRAVADWFEEKERGIITASYLTGVRIGQALIGGVGPFLLATYGSKMFFLATGLVPLLWLLPWWQVVGEQEAHVAAQPIPPAARTQTSFLAGLGLLRQRTALGVFLGLDRKSTRLNSSHIQKSRMPSSA